HSPVASCRHVATKVYSLHMLAVDRKGKGGIVPTRCARRTNLPVISFASPKGGAGKSTSAVLLACEIVQSGRKGAVIDADPNRPVFRWAQRPGKPENLAVFQDVTEETIIDTIENASVGSNFVIVDLEGTASIMVALAISRADLVIIPSQGSQLD